MRCFMLLSLFFCFLHVVISLPLSQSLPGTQSAVKFRCQDVSHSCTDAETHPIFRREPSRRRTHHKKVDQQKVKLVKTRLQKPNRYNKLPVKFNKEQSKKDKPNYSAGRVLDKMDLSAAERKKIEDYHVWVVKHAMKKVPAAKSAEIINLAHSKGSIDQNIHISAIFRNAEGRPIQAGWEGDPSHLSDIRHIYVNPHDKTKGLAVLPEVYKTAVKNHQKRIHKKFDKI